VAASTFGTPTSGTVAAGAPLAVTSSPGAGVSASVSVPAGALPAGTVLSVYPVVNKTALASQVTAGQSYVASFAVSWQAPNGTTPTASAPITMTIVDPAITAGETVYLLTANGLVAAGSATANGTVTITFTSDPVFVVASLTARRLSLKDHKSVTIIGYDGRARAGAKVSIELIRSHRVIKRASVKIGPKHRYMWTSARLTTGTYTVRFTISGRLFKTTTVTIAAEPRQEK
jgi:S-adenosylmethionine hydrolase